MTLPGLVAAQNLADVVDREKAWDNLGQDIQTTEFTRTWDAAKDLRASLGGTRTNPNGQWSYGRTTELSSTSLTLSAIPTSNGWQDVGLLGTPFFTVDLSANSLISSHTPINIPGGFRVTVLRWTAPFNALLNIQSLITKGGTGALRFQVQINSSVLFTGPVIVGGGSTSSYNANFIPIATGDFLDFKVDLVDTADFDNFNFNVSIVANSYIVTGKDILALNGVSNASTRNFIFIKGLISAAQPRLTIAAQQTASATALRDQALLRNAPSSAGDYFAPRGIFDGGTLRINGIQAASLSSSPFSGSTALFPISIRTMELSSNFRLAASFPSGTISSPERAIPIETTSLVLYAKAGQS